jgi:hypothetical protein
MTFWKFWNGLSVILGAGALIAVVLAIKQQSKLPVRFKSLDELNAITAVARWAQQQVSADDPRRKRLGFLSVFALGVWVPMSIRISAQDLALLAPFIDRSIAGEGPPSPLPAEYEDWQPEALRGFKARMTAEGLWPEDARTADVMPS